MQENNKEINTMIANKSNKTQTRESNEKMENYKNMNLKSENSRVANVNSRAINVNSDFDENLLEFAMEEKFKLLNYTYEFISKMYVDLLNFPKKHELIKDKLIQTAFDLLERISSGNYSHNKKYKRQMADEAVSKVKTINFLLSMIENQKIISNKITHRLKLQLDEISRCLVGWRKAI